MARIWARSIALTAAWLSVGVLAEEYEPERFESPASLHVPAKLLSGPHHSVGEMVTTQGFMNHFTVQSTFGEFIAISNDELAYRVREIRAIAILQDSSKTQAFIDALAQTAQRPVETLKDLARDPVETAKGIPDGVSRLFQRTQRVASDSYEKLNEMMAQEEDQDGGESSEESMLDSTLDAGESFAKEELGFNRARRQVARELHVDPYSRNPVFQEELGQMAWVVAGGSLAMGSVLPSLPSEVGALSDINDLVWDTDPLDLELQNEEKLRAMGVRDDVIRTLYKSPFFTTTTRTRLVESLAKMGNIPGLPILVEHATDVVEQDEARFFGGMGETLGLYHQNRAPIVRIIDTQSLPAAVNANDQIIIILHLDFLTWTEVLHDFVDQVTAEIADRAPGYGIELWVEGKVSDLARSNIYARKWTIHDQYRGRLGKPTQN